MKKSNKISYKRKLLVTLVQISLGIELGAILIPGFSDMWRKTFRLWTSTFGRLTGLIPFSIGELMIIAGLIWLCILIPALVIHIIRRISRTSNKPGSGKGKKAGSPGSGVDLILRFTNVILTFICVVMIFNCFSVYHCTRMRTKFAAAAASAQEADTDVRPKDTSFLKGYVWPVIKDKLGFWHKPADENEFTLEELARLRDHIVERCNEMSLIMERDANGDVISPGESYMQAEARNCMDRLSSRFPDLSGYQTTPKPLIFSEFMCQQDMMGYYFPFSLEANYNTLMVDLCKPFTMCHELSHTHGYIYEDEANFLSFLACMTSDDPYFVYSGYLNVLHYVNNDFYKKVGKDVYREHPAISELVYYDSEYVRDDVRANVEEHAIIPTEVVKEGADLFVDTTLKVNGVSAGKESYNEVVELLLYEMSK